MNLFLVRMILATAFLTEFPVAVFTQQPDPSGPSVAEARFLTVDPGARDYWPCFSPDGKTVLFSRTTDGGKTWELFVVPASGGEAHRLMDSPLPMSATRADWSRHNSVIAFTGESPDGAATVWLINPDGTNPRQLTSAGLSPHAFYPSWYPDGESLAVMDAAELVIKRIDLRGRAAVTVTNRGQVLSGMPRVSPDGQWIAFAGQKNTRQAYDQTRNSIWLVSNTGELRSLEPTPGQGRTPAWSPDAKRLVFSARHAKEKEATGIAIMNVAKP